MAGVRLNPPNQEFKINLCNITNVLQGRFHVTKPSDGTWGRGCTGKGVCSDINTTKEREILIIMILCCSPKFGGLGREDILQVSKRTSRHFIA